MSHLSADTLFHFTPKFEYLESILEKGFIPRYCLEFEDSDGYLVDILSPGFIAMVCFCDIPLEHINNHTSIYGKYGISLTKEWGIKKGLSPVFYVNRESFFMKLFRERINVSSNSVQSLINHIRSLNSYPDLTSFLNSDVTGKLSILFMEAISSTLSIGTLTSFFKPYQGDYTRNGKTTKKYRFYDEKEWRYLPDHTIRTKIAGPFKFADMSEDDRIRQNEYYEKDVKFHLQFECEDIESIILKDLSEEVKFSMTLEELSKKQPTKYTVTAIEELKSRIKII